MRPSQILIETAIELAISGLISDSSMTSRASVVVFFVFPRRCEIVLGREPDKGGKEE